MHIKLDIYVYVYINWSHFLYFFKSRCRHFQRMFLLFIHVNLHAFIRYLWSTLVQQHLRTQGWRVWLKKRLKHSCTLGSIAGQSPTQTWFLDDYFALFMVARIWTSLTWSSRILYGNGQLWVSNRFRELKKITNKSRIHPLLSLFLTILDECCTIFWRSTANIFLLHLTRYF